MKQTSKKDWVDNLIDDYYSWLRDRTAYRTDSQSGWSVISTPYIGLFNDNIEIYVQLDGNTIHLSDDGVTLSNLSDIGVNINRSSTRREWVNYILRNYGISEQDGELYADATIETFPQIKHNLISAIVGISDLEITARENVASMFTEDVQKYFDSLGIIYTPQYIAQGKTGLNFTFDFQIAGKTQETVVKTFSSLNKNNVSLFLFGWDDIRDNRLAISRKKQNALAIINDLDKPAKDDYTSALTNRGASCFLWKNKDTENSKSVLYGLTA